MEIPGLILMDELHRYPKLQKLQEVASQPHTDIQKEAIDAYRRIMDAIENDDTDQFLRWIESPALLHHLPEPRKVSKLGRSILTRGAVKCADLILSNLTDGILDTHFGFPRGGWSPLHQACMGLRQPMLQLLFDCGYFDPDLRADMPYVETRLHLKQALPLNVGLRTVRYFISETRELTAFSLVNYFCTKMDQQLDAIRLLALNTRDFKEEFLNYAKQGKVVELNALLLAAGDKLLPLRISEGRDGHDFNSFKELRDFLQDNKNGWSLTISNDDEFAEWKETLKLLDIYDKIGYQLTAYAALKKCRRSGMEVQDLLKAHGFDVKSADNNLHNNVHVESSNKLKALHSGMENSGMKESGMENSGMKESGMENSGMKESGMERIRIPWNNMRKYVNVDRSNDTSFKSSSCHHSTPEEKTRLQLTMLMNLKPKPSPVPMAAKGLHGVSKSNYSTSAVNTKPMKWLNAIQNHNSNNSWLPFLRILSKRVRRV